MAKRIVVINHNTYSDIYVGREMPLFDGEMVENLIVKRINYSSGSCGEDYYKESYTVHFENSTKTLEVFDVNYVIRDEE